MQNGKKNNKIGSKGGQNGKAGQKNQIPLKKSSGPSRQLSAPVAKARSMSASFNIGAGKRPNSLRIQGHDYLGQYTFASTATEGTNIANIFINPLLDPFTSTRLSLFAAMFDKYIFNNMTFHVVPSAPSTETGSYGVAFDVDIADQTPGADSTGVRQYIAMEASEVSTIWLESDLPVRLKDPQDFYYTNWTGIGDLRLTHQGQFYIFSVSPPAVNRTLALWITYDVELFDPQLDTGTLLTEAARNSGANTTSSSANAGWNHLQTAIKDNPLVPFTVDSFGNWSFSLPAGTWILEDFYKTTTAPYSKSTITASPVVAGQTVSNTILNNIASIAGGSGLLTQKWSIPNGGAKLYATNSSATNIVDEVVRFFRVPATYQSIL